MLVSNILSVLVLLVILSAIEAKNPEVGEIYKGTRPLKAWINSANSMLCRTVDHQLTRDQCLSTLNSLVELENVLNRIDIDTMTTPKQLNYLLRNKSIRFYRNRWTNLIDTTSLIRKRKSLAENLLTILNTNMNGCMFDYLEKLTHISRQFEEHPALTAVFQDLIRNQILNCRDRITLALIKPLKLLGDDYINRMVNLYNENSNPTISDLGIQYLPGALARYIMNLDHPLLESIDIISTQGFAIMLEIYATEIVDVSSKVCSAGNPFLRLIASANYVFTNSPNDTRKKWIENMNNIVNFACMIESYDVIGIVPNILKEYKLLINT